MAAEVSANPDAESPGAADGDVTSTGDTPTGKSTVDRTWWRRPLPVAAALLALTVLVAGWSGTMWLRAANDDGLAIAGGRDAALAAGREQVATLNSLDHNRVDEDIARWQEVTTGALRDELARTDDETRKTLRDHATVTNGKVLDAGVSEYDERAGTARMLVSLEITVARGGAAPATNRNRFTAALARTDAGWKVSALDQVPIGAA